MNPLVLILSYVLTGLTGCVAAILLRPDTVAEIVGALAISVTTSAIIVGITAWAHHIADKEQP